MKNKLLIAIVAVVLLIVVFYTTKKKAKAAGIEEGNKYANDAFTDATGANQVQNYFYEGEKDKQEKLNTLLSEYTTITGKSAVGKYNTIEALEKLVKEEKLLRELEKEYEALTGINIDITHEDYDSSSEVQGLITAYKMQEEEKWTKRKAYLDNRCDFIKNWGQLPMKEVVNSRYYASLTEISNFAGSDAVYFVRYYDKFVSKVVNKSGTITFVETGSKDIYNLLDFCNYFIAKNGRYAYLRSKGFPIQIVEKIRTMVERVYNSGKTLNDITSWGTIK